MRVNRKTAGQIAFEAARDWRFEYLEDDNMPTWEELNDLELSYWNTIGAAVRKADRDLPQEIKDAIELALPGGRWIP